MLKVTGNHFVANGGLIFSTPAAEAYVPTGYEAKAGGNYDSMPKILVAPTPTPQPPREATVEDPYLSARAPGCTWKTFWPNSSDYVIQAHVYTFSNTSVVAQVPQNHAYGHYFRIGVPSTVDRSVIFTDAYFLPMFQPTIQALDPPSLPLSGGVLNIIGHSFGNGGRVYIKQRLYYYSTSVPGDPVYAGVHPLPHEADTFANVPGDYLGRAGGTIGFRRRTLVSPAMLDAEIEIFGETSLVLPQRRLATVNNAAQYSSRYTYAECMLLHWNQTVITCLTQPGMDNQSTVIVDVGWGRGTLENGLLFQPTLPCMYNTTFNGTFIGRTVSSFQDQFVVGLWTGLAVGFGALIVVTGFATRMARISILDIVLSFFGFITVKPKRLTRSALIPDRGGSAEVLVINPAGVGGPRPQSAAPAGDSTYREDEVDERTGKRRGSRRTSDDVVLAKQREALGRSGHGSVLDQSGFVQESMLSDAVTGIPSREKRASDASFREMTQHVEREATLQLEEREHAELVLYRLSHGMDEYGNVVPTRKWWQCCCCRFRPPAPPPQAQQAAIDGVPTVSTTDEMKDGELLPQSMALSTIGSELMDMRYGSLALDASMVDSQQRYGVRFQSSSHSSRSDEGGSRHSQRMPDAVSDAIGSHSSPHGTGKSAGVKAALRAVSQFAASPPSEAALRGKTHPLAPPGVVVEEGDVMRRGVFGASPGAVSAKSPVLRAFRKGSESDGSDGEC